MRQESGTSGQPSGGRNRPGRGLAADEGGSAAIEFAFVGPILVLLLVGIVQFGAAFFLHSEMLNVARETARRLATGDLAAGQARAWVMGQLPGRGRLAVTVTAPGGGSDLYRVALSLPLAEVTGIDPFGLFGNRSLSVAVAMRDESGAT